MHAVFKATGKGVFWGLSCLVCLLGDLGFGTKTASLLEEEKRWGGGRGRGGGRGWGGRAEVPTEGRLILSVNNALCFPIFQQLLKPKLCKVLYTEEETGP